MAIRLYRSNRTEVLAARLGNLVAQPLDHPFAAETIAVQGPGMERWLAMTLARRFGVWANGDFPFPRALLERVLTAALGEPESELTFDARDLGWAVAQLLRERQDDPQLGAVRRYMRDTPQADAWLGLGMRIGEVFDRYLVYRPELLLGYEQGHGDDFQAVLWRAVVERFGGEHIARRAQRYLELAAAGASLLDHDPSFPQRISLFGISTLPPIFVQVLGALSAQREVHLFALTPSREYWGDLPRRTTRSDARALLGSVGKLSGDFQDVLEERTEYVEPPEGDLFVDPGTDSLLHALQSDLLHLRSRAPDAPDTPLSLSPSDRSLRVHDCHSRTRELEVLRDQLLDLLERDTSLSPRDIVVLAPDIEAYAPSIEAVFGTAHGAGALPYRIADRDLGQTSELTSNVFAILQLASSRVSLSEVNDLLHSRLVYERFELGQSDVPLLVRWLHEAGARWGLDAEHRAEHGQPADRSGTFEAALQRLLLGHAMSAEDEPLFAGTLPYDDVEGEAERLERLARFIETLTDVLRGLKAPRPAAEWARDVAAAMDALLADDARTAAERHWMRDALSQLGAAATRAACDGPLSLTAFGRVLERQLNASARSHGFLQGGITFCRHVPMRALPFRVVCLLGLDDESYPRRNSEASFDLVAQRPRRGDRNAADDDRQVFLEALLCARDVLIITYRGRAIEDDSERPRAAVVDQLLDVIDESFVVESQGGTLSLPFARETPRQRVLVSHPLWPFDAKYFERPRDSEWFTYDALAQQARAAFCAPPAPQTSFVRGALAEREPLRNVELEALIRFLRNPARAFLQDRLKIVLPRDQAALPDREPPPLFGLDRYWVADYLRERAQLPEAELLPRLWARGLLPLGDGGACELQALRAAVNELLARAALSGTPKSVRVDAELSGTRLIGRLTDVYPQGRSELVVSLVRPKHLLTFWIRQLALCSVEPAAGRLVGRGQGKRPVSVWHVEPIPYAKERLGELLALMHGGQRWPLPLYPQASHAFASARLAGEEPHQALQKATRAFVRDGGTGMAAECEALELSQLYGYATSASPLAAQPPALPAALAFEPLSELVFEPMLRALEAIE